MRPTPVESAGKWGDSLPCVTVTTKRCLFLVSGLAEGRFRRKQASGHSCVARKRVHGDWSKP